MQHPHLWLAAALTLSVTEAVAARRVAPPDYRPVITDDRYPLSGMDMMGRPLGVEPLLPRRSRHRKSSRKYTPGNLTTISIRSGGKLVTAKVAASAAPQFQGFIQDLKAAGYPIKFMGGWRVEQCAPPRHKHGCGWALDVNQYSRNVVVPKMSRGAVEALAQKHGLFSGSAWPRHPDTGHFELTTQSIAALGRPRKPTQVAVARPEAVPAPPPPLTKHTPYIIPREPTEVLVQTASASPLVLNKEPPYDFPLAVAREEPSVPEEPIQEMFLPVVEPPKPGLIEMIKRYVVSKDVVYQPWVVTVCPGNQPLPVGLNTMLKEAHEHFNATVVVNSAYRDKKKNRKVGGARYSQHMACKAVDFRVVGVSAKQLKVWVVDNRARWGVKGVGFYGVNGHLHADLRSALRLVTWNGGKPKTRYAKRHHHRRYAKA